jgi:hypothetical protein
MTSRIRATKMRAARAALLVAALVVAVVAALGATTALAAVPGDPLKLGQLNTINALTRLVGTRATTLLQVKNDGGPALNLTVPAGQAPLVVSAGAGTAPNLSADKLDGKDATAFLPTRRTHAPSRAGARPTSWLSKARAATRATSPSAAATSGSTRRRPR